MAAAGLAAQQALPPSAHGGNPAWIFNPQDPAQSRPLRNPQHDYSKFNPRYRSLLPQDRTCVTLAMEQERQAANASEQESTEAFEQWMESARRQAQQSRGSSRRAAVSVYSLPVVVHVIYSNPIENISDAQVLSQIEVLNADYRQQNANASITARSFQDVAVDTEIGFCLAGRDPQGKPTNGIHRVAFARAPFTERYINEVIKPATIWDPTRYFNLWVCNIAGGVLGFAQFPQSAQLTGLPAAPGAAMTDGVVINYTAFGTQGTAAAPFDRGRTATHEIGHWLGLRHIWGDGPCGVDDFCEDTPDTDDAHYGCPPGSTGCSGVAAMVQNYMDYTDDACMSFFTQDQKTRMRLILENSPRRRELLSSDVCERPAAPPEPAFSADVRSGCGPLRVAFTDQSAGSPQSYAWSFPGGKPEYAAVPNPVVTYRKPGRYPVTLAVRNAAGERSKVQDSYIEVLAQGQPLPFVLDLEAGAFPPPGLVAYNPQDDATWVRSERFSARGQGSGSLRMGNFDYNLLNVPDAVLTPILSLAGGKETRLSFDVAYAPFSGSYSDSLGIFIAAGCSQTFQCIYFKGGKTLSTAPATEDAFVPRPDQWRTERIDLSAYDGQPLVQIAIVNFSGHGNDLYLDNLRIESTPLPPPAVEFETSARKICAGASITFTDRSAHDPVNWYWSFPGGTPSADTLRNPIVRYAVPGVYEVTLTAVNASGSHTVTRSAWIEVQALPELSLKASASAVCQGQQLTLTASGPGPFAWTLPPGVSAPPGSSLTLYPEQDFVYRVSARNALGCAAEASAAVAIRPGRSLAVQPPAASICPGGSVALSVTGGQQYRWSPAEGLNYTEGGLVQASPRRTTTYTVTGTGDTGCEMRKQVTVTVEEPPRLGLFADGPLQVCPGGAVTLRADGAAAYSWSPASSLNRSEGNEVIARPLRTATYRVEARSASGCLIRDSIAIRVLPQPAVSLSASAREICAGTAITLRASGAQQYVWPEGQLLNGVSGSSAQAAPQQSSSFQVVGYSADGCTDTASAAVAVRQPEPLVITPAQAAVCRGGSVILSVSGASGQIVWDAAPGLNTRYGPRVSAAPVQDQTYTARATDRYGCVSAAQAAVSVAAGQRPRAAFSSDETLTCAGQPVKFISQSEGAESYFWEFPGGQPATSTLPNPEVTYAREGIYDAVLTVTGCNGTQDRKESIGHAVITAPVNLRLNTGDVSVCRGQPFTLTATGARQYEWQAAEGLSTTVGSRVEVRPARTTTYTVTGTDEHGCQASRSVTLSLTGSGAPVRILPDAPVICQGESVQLEASGGYTYQWSPAAGLSSTRGASVLARPVQTSRYIVQATDLDGCVYADTVEVEVRPAPELQVTPSAPSVCAGETVELRTSVPGAFTWSPSAGLSAATGTVVQAFPRETTSYTVRGKTEAGCALEAQVTVTVRNAGTLQVQADAARICSGQQVLLTASGGSDYRWSPAEGLDRSTGPVVKASPLKTTRYEVVSGAGGCGSVRSVTVEVVQPGVITFKPQNPQLCKGDTLQLEALGGKAYVWAEAPGLQAVAGARVQVFPASATLYRVDAIDAQGCETSGSVTVTVDPGKFLRVASQSASVCKGAEVALAAEGGESYEWLGLPDAASARLRVRPESDGEYRVAARNQLGCRDTAAVRVSVRTVRADFAMPADTIDLAVHPGALAFADRSAGATAWFWTFGRGSTSDEASPVHVFSAAGVYPVTLFAGNEVCQDQITRQLVVRNSSRVSDLDIQVSQAEGSPQVTLELNSPRPMFVEFQVQNAGREAVLENALRIPAGSFRKQIDLKAYPAGAYTLLLLDGVSRYEKSIVIP
jgi:PKD repeat protein